MACKKDCSSARAEWDINNSGSHRPGSSSGIEYRASSIPGQVNAWFQFAHPFIYASNLWQPAPFGMSGYRIEVEVLLEVSTLTFADVSKSLQIDKDHVAFTRAKFLRSNYELPSSILDNIQLSINLVIIHCSINIQIDHYNNNL